MLNKRVRSSFAKTLVEFRNGLPRQPLMTKEHEMRKDVITDLDVSIEKTSRLTVGAESWDKGRKRRRSIGAACSRFSDGNTEVTSYIPHNPTSEPAQSSNSQNFSSNARAAPTNQLENSAMSRDTASGYIKEQILPKASINISPGPISQRKAMRAPRGPLATATSTVCSIPSVAATLESWEPPSSNIRNSSINGTRNSRPLPSGSSSPPMVKWVGQRPQKMYRTRRVNLILPVSNPDGVQISIEGCSRSDFGDRSPSSVSAAHVSYINKVKTKSVPSHCRLSERDESGSGESSLKDKDTGSTGNRGKSINSYKYNGPAFLAKKNKLMVKEDERDMVKRQGWMGRIISASRAITLPIGEKLANATIDKSVQIVRPTDINGSSKTGSPLKKISHPKGFSRHQSDVAGSYIGEADDDREELISAANLAFNSSLLACSSAFWKKAELLFVKLSPEGILYIAEQRDHTVVEMSASHTLYSKTNGHVCSELGQTALASQLELDQFQSSIVSGNDSFRISDKVIPLYQRVLSALITDDEECEENGAGSCVSYQNTSGNSPEETHCHVDSQSKFTDRSEYECESSLGVQAFENDIPSRYLSCNRFGHYVRSPDVPDPPCNGELLEGDCRNEHLHVEAPIGLSLCNSDGPGSLQKHSGFLSFSDSQYEHTQFEDTLLLELQCIGLFLESVPYLHHEDCRRMDEEIVQLQRKLFEQIGRKKTCLDKIHKLIQGHSSGGRDPEHVAMDRLVELAYKKNLAGNLAIKYGIPKVSKRVALAFARRTLVRCKKYEESGVSCFNDTFLGDIIYAVPPRVCEDDPLINSSLSAANGSFVGSGYRGPADGFEPSGHHIDRACGKGGPLLDRGKKKDGFLDDVVGGAAFRSSTGSSLSGCAKGERSERDKAGWSMGNSKGERKTKTKVSQRTDQLSTTGGGYINKLKESMESVSDSISGSLELINSSGTGKREVDWTSACRFPPVSFKDKTEVSEFVNTSNDMYTIDELGVESDLVGSQDLNSWFTFRSSWVLKYLWTIFRS